MASTEKELNKHCWIKVTTKSGLRSWRTAFIYAFLEELPLTPPQTRLGALVRLLWFFIFSLAAPDCHMPRFRDCLSSRWSASKWRSLLCLPVSQGPGQYLAQSRPSVNVWSKNKLISSRMFLDGTNIEIVSSIIFIKSSLCLYFLHLLKGKLH